MKYRKVTAIIPKSVLEKVEQALYEIGIPGMTVSKTHGLGEYRNYYASDHMSDCSRIEIFIEEDKAKIVASTIARASHQGLDTDGIIAILPVEEFIHINDYVEE